jgi:ribonuclease BN (tRNA processing enzyme)
MIMALFHSPIHAENLELTATIIGSGSPVYNAKRASAGVLITQGNTQILVDMGPGVYANLNRAGIDSKKFDALMFTHHHIDHNAEFISLLTQNLVGHRPFAIYGPTDTTKFTTSFLDLYHEDFNYRLGKTGRTIAQRTKDMSVNDLKSGDSFTIGNINVSTLNVPHTIETLAYRFDYQDQSIVITGDLTFSDELPDLAKGADCMIIDSGGMIMEGKINQQRPGQKENSNRTGNKESKNNPRDNKRKPQTRAHLDLDDSSLMAQQAGVHNLVYTHFLPGIIDETASLAVIKQHYTGNVIFGTDLMTLNCGNSAQ